MELFKYVFRSGFSKKVETREHLFLVNQKRPLEAEDFFNIIIK